jgi:hypothetical protein
MTSQLTGFLTCKYPGCDKYFREPVKLPCDTTICNEHIESAKADNSDKFKCLLCDSDHVIPSGGRFKPNFDIQNILEMNLHLNSKQKDLTESKFKLKQLIKEMLDVTSETYIHNFLSNIKNEIKKHGEDLKEQISKLEIQLFNEIDEYENELIKSRSNIKDSIDQMKENVKRLDINLLELDQELRTPNLNDKQLEKLNKEIQDEISKSKKKITNLKSGLMNKHKVSFEKNELMLDKLAFGTIKIKPLNDEQKEKVQKEPSEKTNSPIKSTSTKVKSSYLKKSLCLDLIFFSLI